MWKEREREREKRKRKTKTEKKRGSTSLLKGPLEVHTGFEGKRYFGKINGQSDDIIISTNDRLFGTSNFAKWFALRELQTVKRHRLFAF